jgi:predicted lysophospholipase L1 biosynthesis ABC-type transport system permease subunit
MTARLLSKELRMSKKFMAGAIALTVVVAAAAGCQDTPQSVRRVDQSVLPASAKGMFAQDAQITKVEEVTYSGNVKMYRVHFTSEGKKKTILVNTKDETSPSGVFQHAVH